MACEQLLGDFCFSCQFLYFKPLHHIRDSLHVHPTRLLFLPALFTHATAQIYYKSYFYTVYRGDLICVFLCSSPTIYYHMFCIVFISSSTTNISRSLTLLCSLLLLLFLYDNYLYRQEAFVFFCLFFFLVFSCSLTLFWLPTSSVAHQIEMFACLFRLVRVYSSFFSECVCFLYDST